MHSLAAGSQLPNSGSNNSLMSDLTQQDNLNNSSSSMQFAKATRLSAENSPTKPPTAPLQRPALPVSPAKASSLSSKQLSKQVSKLFVKQSVEHIDESEATIIYQLMSKHKITREKAVRMFLEEHDERLYNPKAVYLFPGEEYIPEEDDEDSEEERRKESMFGRVEYNQKKTTDSDSVSVESPAAIEQRLIGAKKDPDQEALEHALLLSAQEQEFGVNMYDSLTASDQVTLNEYIAQGFTREEGALIIFEEKYGKTRSTQNSSVIPAMPTLRAVHAAHSAAQSHAGSLRSSGTGLVYGSDEDDDEEVEDLIHRGYTREQAIAVIEAHREKAQRAAAQPSVDPSHYFPHPDEERFNLSGREEREVEQLMSREGFSRHIAVETVVQMRHTSSAASVTSHSSHHSYEDSTYASGHSESAEVRRYMERGYTREQALQLVKHKSGTASTASVSSHVRRPSFSSTTSGTDSQYEDTEVTRYMNRGYTREQARELVRRAQGESRTVRLSYFCARCAERCFKRIICIVSAHIEHGGCHRRDHRGSPPTPPSLCSADQPGPGDRRDGAHADGGPRHGHVLLDHAGRRRRSRTLDGQRLPIQRRTAGDLQLPLPTAAVVQCVPVPDAQPANPDEPSLLPAGRGDAPAVPSTGPASLLRDGRAGLRVTAVVLHAATGPAARDAQPILLPGPRAQLHGHAGRHLPPD
jgi:hypothetical protein